MFRESLDPGFLFGLQLFLLFLDVGLHSLRCLLLLCLLASLGLCEEGLRRVGLALHLGFPLGGLLLLFGLGFGFHPSPFDICVLGKLFVGEVKTRSGRSVATENRLFGCTLAVPFAVCGLPPSLLGCIVCCILGIPFRLGLGFLLGGFNGLLHVGILRLDLGFRLGLLLLRLLGLGHGLGFLATHSLLFVRDRSDRRRRQTGFGFLGRLGLGLLCSGGFIGHPLLLFTGHLKHARRGDTFASIRN